MTCEHLKPVPQADISSVAIAMVRERTYVYQTLRIFVRRRKMNVSYNFYEKGSAINESIRQLYDINYPKIYICILKRNLLILFINI